MRLGGTILPCAFFGRSPAYWLQLADGSRLLHFFSARWRHAQQRHLGSYQWLLFLDSDTYVLRDQPLEPFLNFPEDVVLHIRQVWQATAAARTEAGAGGNSHWLQGNR